LCVNKKPRTRGGYSPAVGLQNTNPQWVVAPVEKRKEHVTIMAEIRGAYRIPIEKMKGRDDFEELN